MNLKASLILYSMLLYLRITASQMSGSGGSGNSAVMPMNSSGSASGSGMAPRITNCPVATLNTMVAPQVGLFTVNISITLTATDDSLLSSITFSVLAMDAIQGSSLITNISIAQDGAFLLITINGSALNSIATPTTYVNVTVVANDGFSDSEACIVPVSISYLPADQCRVGNQVRTASEQATSNAQRQLNAIIIPVQQPAPAIGLSVQMLIIEAFVMYLNSFCRLNCDRCSLSSDCGTLLQFCVEFTSENIIILNIIEVPAVSLKRQVSVTTTSNLVIAASVPAEIPVTNNVALVPPETLLQSINDNLNTFENMTGLTLNGNPVVFFTSPFPRIPLDFGKIAVIVLPIVVTVLVLALIAGVAIILLIVYILKAKKRSKVLPADLRQGNQHSSVGKGHMSLEAVDQ